VKLRLGNITTSEAYATLVVTSNLPVSSSVSSYGAYVDIGPHNQRVSQPYLAVIPIVFKGLQPLTLYEYSLAQGGESLFGTFTTLPDNQYVPYSFIVGTCDGPIRRNPMDTFQTIRRLKQTSTIPVLFMATIDDVHYVDEFSVNDHDTGFVSVGAPQETGRPEDYAIGWAANFGLFPSEGKWQMIDRQWVYRNLPHVCSGGDHMIEGNHCRGRIGDSDYHGCDRSPGGLQDVALTEWAAFFGNANPQPLRSGELYWGKDVGPLRMVSTDMQLHCEPYSDFPSPSDTPMLGSQQISDVMNYLDTSSVPFKLMLHESGFSGAGQPWLEWHQSEAQSWKAQLDTLNNLNGNNGSFFAIYGDVHACHAVSFDSFWAFGAGTLGDANSVGHKLAYQNFGWGGNLEFLWSSIKKVHDSLIGGFYHVIVHADESPQRIEVNFIHGGTGETLFSKQLLAQSPFNQFS